MTKKSNAYWICTGLVVFFIGSGGLAYAMQGRMLPGLEVLRNG